MATTRTSGVHINPSFVSCFHSPMKPRSESQRSRNTRALLFSTSNCHITWAVSYSQHTAKITILVQSKQQGWLIKRRWWSGKYQSDNISGLSGCKVCSVAVSFQWPPCTCASLKAQFVHKCSLQCVCTCVCVCVKGVNVFVASSSPVCVSMCWLAVLVAHSGWRFMISIFRFAWLGVWKPTYTQNKHTETHTHRKKHMETHTEMVWNLMKFHDVSITVL